MLDRFDFRIGPTFVAWCERVKDIRRMNRPITDPFSVKMAKIDAEDWLNDRIENALIDMWQAKPVLYDVTSYGVIIIGLLK